MKKITIYWLIFILAIGVMFGWQFLSLFSIHERDKENFSNEINKEIYQAVYNMNVLQAGKTPKNHYCGMSAKTRQIVYFRGTERDTITFPPSIGAIEASNRAMYDIRTSYWTLERIDSLFRANLVDDLNIPVFYTLKDSTGNVIASHGEIITADNTIEGTPVKLGFLTIHELNYEYVYPLSLFLRTNIKLLVLVVFLFLFLVFCFIMLFHSLRQARLREYKRDLMVSMIIHNLQTPLSDLFEVQNQLEEMLNGRVDEEEREMLDIMRDELASMSATITRLMNLSTVMDGIKINKEEINLLDLLQNIISRYEATIPRDKQVSFLPRFKLKNDTVRVDPHHFSEISRNLIDNSIKYSGEEVTIEIICEEQENEIVIRFRDDGYGIAPGNMKKVFDPYSRENSKKNEKGHGLGLFYVKLAVEAHGGKVNINPLEKGTEIMITIPR